jgi:hypothetical protein
MQYTNTLNGTIVQATLAASALLGLVSGLGFLALTVAGPSDIATMELTPRAAVVTAGEAFIATVVVDSSVPVNAFTGVVVFDPTALAVTKIDYNTSIADLWAEAPWYKNGAGTIHFAGGTTRSGGFVGRGTIVSITFTAIAPGEAPVMIREAQVLKHDGLGSAVTLTTPLDSIFTITSSPLLPDNLSTVTVRDPLKTGDLNQDRVVSMADISIFLMYATTLNQKGDLNDDGRVSTTDLSILVGQI